MSNSSGPNHPFVVWGACFLWVTSMFAITWSLLLFFCVGDILFLTGTDMVNAFVLLSGLVMLPTNLHMLCSIAQNKNISHKSTVACCPLWLCILWIIIVNLIGAAMCVARINNCKVLVDKQIAEGMKHYRTGSKYKRFIDNLQWTLKCCGLNSYKDWFTRDWYDKIRDYEFEPSSTRKRMANTKAVPSITDSVPLSCCKSGSCISNYLLELGTYSINTSGCSRRMNNIIRISMCVHLAVFMLVVIVEVMILRLIMKKQCNTEHSGKRKGDYNVRHIMGVKDNFHASSESYVIHPEDSDVSSRQYHDEVPQICPSSP